MKSNGSTDGTSTFYGVRHARRLEALGVACLLCLAAATTAWRDAQWERRVASLPSYDVNDLLCVLEVQSEEVVARWRPSKPRRRFPSSPERGASAQRPRAWVNPEEGVGDEGQLAPLNLNAATSEELARFRGIGPVLSERIVKFRDGLGGFAHPELLYHVYGLDSSVVQAMLPGIVATPAEVEATCVGEATFGWLARHPAFGAEGARRVLAANGRGVESMDQLRGRLRVDDATWRRWKPYLTVCVDSSAVREDATWPSVDAPQKARETQVRGSGDPVRDLP